MAFLLFVKEVSPNQAVFNTLLPTVPTLVVALLVPKLQNISAIPYNQKKDVQIQQLLVRQKAKLAEWEANMSGWYPPDYAFSRAANSFIRYLQNNRADDLRQCIELYEQDCYRKGMHEKTQRMLEAAEKAVAETEKIKDAVNETNFLLWWRG